MDELLTWDEIERRFDGEWVLLGETETADNLEVIRGRVLWHTKDHDEVWRKALEMRPRHPGVFFIGEPDTDVVFIL